MHTGGNRSGNKLERHRKLPNQILGHSVEFWITLLRGIFAIILGIVLLIQPQKTLPWLANFMGAYWLTSGVISIRFGASGRRAGRLALIAGVIGVIAGLAMLGRPLFASWVAEEILLSLLGVIILLTGALHASGGFRKRTTEGREWTWTSFLLGIFEIILGLNLIISPFNPDNWVYLTASIWALLGGLILIGDALYLRQLAKKTSII